MDKVPGQVEFLILGNDAEDIVMVVHWYQKVTNGVGNNSNIRISDMKILEGTPFVHRRPKPIEAHHKSGQENNTWHASGGQSVWDHGPVNCS